MLFDREYKYILTCDLETNGVSPHDQWLEGSFGLLDFNSLDLIKEVDIGSKPQFWNREAYEIHGIREEVAFGFQDRTSAILQLNDFLPPKEEFIFLCHANVGLFGKYYHFDFAVLKSDYEMTFDSRFEFEKYYNMENVTSTHTMAKRLQKSGLLPKELKKNLEALCKFFDIPYGKHNARLDRISMEMLLRKLNELEPQQLSLI